MKRFSKSILVLTVAASLLHCSFIPTAFAGTLPAGKPSPYPGETQVRPAVTAQPDVGPDVMRYFNDPSKDPELPPQMLVTLLRQRIKYVFIIFNENHSFDNEYGTFPGVNGIYSDGMKPRSPAGTPGFTQTYTDVSGVKVTVQPFRIGPALNSSVVDSVDHSHPGLAKKIHMVDGVAQMDGFAGDEYARFASKGGAANAAEGKQFARLVMSHIDCDTIPFFWQWASRFTVFDNIFATEDTPSTPNAVAMIAGQSGETQWVKHGPAGGPHRGQPHRHDAGSAACKRSRAVLRLAIRHNDSQQAARRPEGVLRRQPTSPRT